MDKFSTRMCVAIVVVASAISAKKEYLCDSVSAVMISVKPATTPVSVPAIKNPADLLAVLTAVTDSL